MNENKLVSKRFTKRGQGTLAATLEMLPYGKTLETIQTGGCIEADVERQNTVKVLKKYFDAYIVDAVSRALQEFGSETFDFDELYGLYKEMRRFKGDAAIKAYDDKKGELLSLVKKAITEYTAYPNGKMPVAMEKEDFCFTILPDYMDANGWEEDAESLRNMKGMLTLFNKIAIVNKTALTNSIPNRVIENLELYLSNIPAFERMYEDNDIEIAEWRKNFSEELSIYKTPSGYLYAMTGAGIDAYNKVISGVMEERGIVVKGLNLLANEKNHAIKSNNLDIPNYKLAKQLYKQILVPKEKAFTIDTISSNEELLDCLKVTVEAVIPVCADINSFFEGLADKKLFIKGQRLHTISKYALNDINIITTELMDLLEMDIKAQNLTKKATEKALDGRANQINKTTYTLDYLKSVTGEDIAATLVVKEHELYTEILAAKDALDHSEIYENTVKGSEKYTKELKNFYEAVSELRRFITLFSDVDQSTGEVTEDTLAVQQYMDSLYINTKAENMSRNYITRGYKDEVRKVPMSFNVPLKFNAAWLNLHQDPKMQKSKHTIIRMDGKFYFFTLSANAKPVAFVPPTDGEESVELYSCAKGQNAIMVVPKFAFPKRLKAFFEKDGGNLFVLTEKDGFTEQVVCTKETYDIYKNGLYTTGAVKKGLITQEIYEENLYKLLLYYKDVVTKLNAWALFDLSDMPDVKTFANAGEFLTYLNTKTVNMSWVKTSKKQVLDLVENGWGLMFELYTSKLYKEGKKKGKVENIFLTIFSPENMANPNLILNGRPTIFFREAVIKDRKVAHKKGSQLLLKNDVNGNALPKNVYDELYHYFNGRLQEAQLSKEAVKYIPLAKCRECPFDIYYRDRYTRDKFYFTFTYTINKQVDTDTTGRILNDDIAELEQNREVNYLSVTRGLEHLIYYVLSDPTGKVLKEGNLDNLENTNWREKLVEIGKQRAADKKDWVYDTECASVKDKYVAVATGTLAKMAVENNAVILLQTVRERDRNQFNALDGQVFQKLENALIARLSNYYIKGAADGEVGSMRCPLQLSFASEMFKNHGIVKSVSPAYVRSMDPKSGFYNMLKFSEAISVKKKRAFLSNMEIAYMEDYFSCAFDYNDFSIEGTLYGKTDWELRLAGERTVYDVNSKKLQYYSDLCKYLVKEFTKIEGHAPLKGEKLDIESLKNETVVLLFNAVRTVVSSYVKKCDEVPNEYRVSPVTGERINNPMGEITKLQIRKHLYGLDHNGETVEVLYDGWVRSLQGEN
jgi:CRISPR-associated protein Cpf1